MKAILFVLVLNLMVVNAQRSENLTIRRQRCSLNFDSCPRGFVCRRSNIDCFRVNCPLPRPTCQIRTCQDLRCPRGFICRDSGNFPARCIRSTGQLGNFCPRGSVQIGNRRCFSSRQCGVGRRTFCSNNGGFNSGVCCRRRNMSSQKPGRCPRRNRQQITTCDVQCISDNECPGRRKCCQIGCSRSCTRPVNLNFAF